MVNEYPTLAPCVRGEFASLKSYISLARTVNQRADLAQLVERVAFNHVVVGSSPTVGAFIDFFMNLEPCNCVNMSPPNSDRVSFSFSFFNSIL